MFVGSYNQTLDLLALIAPGMGRKKVAKTEPGSELRLERLANHILRRERRKGAQPRCIDSIIAALRDTQWYLPILPSDIVASQPELDDAPLAAGIAGGRRVTVSGRDHAGIVGVEAVGVSASSSSSVASSCMELVLLVASSSMWIRRVCVLAMARKENIIVRASLCI